MSVESYYIDEIQDYLEAKCQLNKLVQHNKILAGKTKPQRTFARFESDEHIRAIQNCAGENIVVVADFYGQRIGEIDDKQLRMTLQLRFACRKPVGTKDETTAINEAVKKAEKLMFQFWNQMESDFQDGCNALQNLEPEQVTWNKIDDAPWLDNYYGWDLNIPFGSYMPEHNTEDWEEEV
jgi:hypothetical protein